MSKPSTTAPVRALLAAAAALLALTAPTLATSATPLSPPELAALKRNYLACDRAASQRLLGFDEATACSHVSEALLQHGFGGDFGELLAWWRGAKAQAEVAQTLRGP